jgi:hypothetical protein
MIPSVYTCWKTLNDPSKHRFPHTLVEWAVEEEVGTIPVAELDENVGEGRNGVNFFFIGVKNV